MSASNVSSLLNKATLPTSPGGAKIYRAELDAAWQEAMKPEGSDPAGKPIQQAEAKLFQDLVDKPMSFYAKTRLQEILQKIPSLVQSDTPTGPSTPLAPSGSRKPVFINAEGWPAALPNVSGQPATAQTEEGMYRTALVITQSMQSGARVGAIDQLPLETKAKLIDNAIAMAKKSVEAPGGQIDGLTKDQAKQLRSSAFTILWYLGAGMPPSGSTANLQAKIHGALVKMADSEPDKFFGRHISRMLDRNEYTAKLTADQKADVKEIFEAKHPQKFDVGNILDSQGYISWEHVCGEGEGFFKSFVQNLQKKSIGGVKFKKVSQTWDKAELELTFNPPRGENGRVKGIRISVREFNDDMYATVGKKKGFSYGGHSSIGENQERSMINALKQGLKANSPQLAMFDLCAGLDNLDDALENLGNIEVLTTHSSSFFWKGKLTDDNGNEFEGVRSSEGMDTLMAMFESLAQEENYEGMRTRVSDAIYNFAHQRNPNVVFPTIKDYREARWQHLDGDGDGRMDANDVFYQFGLKTASKDLQNEFKLKDSGAPEELSGEAVKNAILDLNVATHYNTSTHNNSQVEHAFSAGGWFESNDPYDLVRFTPALNHDGKKMVEVSVNSKLAHASREALEALVQYWAIVSLSDQSKIQGLGEVDRKLMGLTFATFRLNYDGQDRMNDQRIWKQLLQLLRLPADMPYGSLESLVDAEHHDYSGNMKIVNDYKALLSPAVIAALETHDVGRPGAGAPEAPIS
jgi:hypothetical protein